MTNFRQVLFNAAASGRRRRVGESIRGEEVEGSNFPTRPDTGGIVERRGEDDDVIARPMTEIIVDAVKPLDLDVHMKFFPHFPTERLHERLLAFDGTAGQVPEMALAIIVPDEEEASLVNDDAPHAHDERRAPAPVELLSPEEEFQDPPFDERLQRLMMSPPERPGRLRRSGSEILW